MTWRHVRSRHNPADILSRGCTPLELLGSRLLSEGSEFFIFSVDAAHGGCHRKWIFRIVLYSKIHLGKCRGFFGYTYRFFQTSRRNRETHKRPVTVKEIKGSTHLLIKWIQRVHFAEEHKALTSKMQLSPKNRLLTLNPFLDRGGLMCVVRHL